MALALEAEALTMRYRRTWGLRDCTFALPAGRIAALIGPNGAGKSTLLRTLLNVERADAGTVSVLGFDPERQGPEVRARTGYVPETGEGTYRWMRVDRFLAHQAAFYPGWDEGYAGELVRLLDVRIESRRRTLSKRHARRLQIVAALAHRPALLLLDELTDGLDPLAREEMLSLLASYLAHTGSTAILSTHLVAEVETLIDHVGVLR